MSISSLVSLLHPSRPSGIEFGLGLQGEIGPEPKLGPGPGPGPGPITIFCGPQPIPQNPESNTKPAGLAWPGLDPAPPLKPRPEPDPLSQAAGLALGELV